MFQWRFQVLRRRGARATLDFPHGELVLRRKTAGARADRLLTRRISVDEALASYAKQADDERLLSYAKRIKVRAIDRMGELIQTVPPKGGQAAKGTVLPATVVPPQGARLLKTRGSQNASGPPPTSRATNSSGSSRATTRRTRAPRHEVLVFIPQLLL
jgi:hypothetical protein